MNWLVLRSAGAHVDAASDVSELCQKLNQGTLSAAHRQRVIWQVYTDHRSPPVQL